ncbi:MAG: FAD-dependent oxidoreductase [Actinobacteria bacterium]|nr:FAD-dependent oxidoreductase [Actinomycetota bacterium]
MGITSAEDAVDVDVDVDVVVVGAGGGGLAAALAVADNDRSVIVLEKLDRPGGNSALSTGSIPAAGSRLQIEAGIVDSAARMAADLIAQSGPHEAENLTHRLSETSAELVDWLVDQHGVQLALITDYKHVGHSVNRLHAPLSRRGIDLTDDLMRACKKSKIDVLTGNPVVELLIEGDKVIGVVVEGDRVERYVIQANAVILAANGFAASSDLMAKWLPEIELIEYFGAHGSTGEALEWGIELGGYLANQHAYQGYAAVAYPHGSILSWTTVEKGAILVDQTGKRMGNETIGYSGFVADLLTGTPPYFVLYDSRIRDVAMKEEEFADLVQIGGAREYQDLAQLCDHFAIELQELSLTVDHYNAAARQVSPDVFNRTDFSMAPLEAPFVASRVTPGVFHTQGGLAVDLDGRVITRQAKPVPGLYAIGGVAAGISGLRGGRGYSSGNGLLSALGLGRLAGLAASQEL